MSDAESFPNEKDVCPKCERVYVHADGHSCDVVRERWLEFTEPLEGGLASPYADIRGLITIAFGNLVEPEATFVALPLEVQGRPATEREKSAAYHAIKGDPKAAGYGWRYAATLTPLRLTRKGMTELALSKFDSNDRVLAKRCPDWDTMPACSRCALHSLAWACGPHAHFPQLFNLVNVRDFEGAAVAIHMNELTPEGVKNTGLVPRNVRNKILMRNAAKVDSWKLDPDTLDWERELEPATEDTIEVGPIIHVDPSEYLGNGEPPPPDDV